MKEVLEGISTRCCCFRQTGCSKFTYLLVNKDTSSKLSSMCDYFFVSFLLVVTLPRHYF